MRTAPLKGDCKVCQYPEALRLAVNGAIWTEEGQRYATYLARAAAVIEGFPQYKIDRKTIRRHTEHVEATMREAHSGEVIAPDQVPLMSYNELAGKARFLGSRVMDRAAELVNHPSAHVLLTPKDLVSVGNLAHRFAATEEQLRVKARGQDAEVIKAVFMASAGHIPTGRDETEDVADMRAEVAEERRLLTERAQA